MKTSEDDWSVFLQHTGATTETFPWTLLYVALLLYWVFQPCFVYYYAQNKSREDWK